LTTLLGVCEDLVSFLDTFKEGIVIRVLVDACEIERAGNDVRRRFLIRMMLEDLFPVCGILRNTARSEWFGRTCDLDLVFGGFVAEVREAKDGVVVLFLDGCWRRESRERFSIPSTPWDLSATARHSPLHSQRPDHHLRRPDQR